MWADLPLVDAIYAAKSKGFAAVECHWPQGQDAGQIRAALTETGLPMVGLNTARGDAAAGEFGLSALPGRRADARSAVDAAVAFARAVGAVNLHVMAGVASGPDAHRAFLDALEYACATAPDLTVVIEPINTFDVPGYFLADTAQAIDIIDKMSLQNLKLMFDCYHVARTEGDVLGRLAACWPHVGHIQFAGVPDRGRPDQGSLDYANVFNGIDRLGWTGFLGAEYKPGGATDDSLGWMDRYSYVNA